MLKLQTNRHSSGRKTGLPSQVKFYRVDIDEEKIAQTVAEAGVASVVRVLGKADVHVPFRFHIEKLQWKPMKKCEQVLSSSPCGCSRPSPSTKAGSGWLPFQAQTPVSCERTLRSCGSDAAHPLKAVSRQVSKQRSLCQPTPSVVGERQEQHNQTSSRKPWCRVIF